MVFLASREKEGDEKTLHGNPMTGNLYWFETKLRERDKRENAAFRKLIEFSSQEGFRNLTNWTKIEAISTLGEEKMVLFYCSFSARSFILALAFTLYFA